MRLRCIHRILQWCCSAYDMQAHPGRWGLIVYQPGKSVKGQCHTNWLLVATQALFQQDRPFTETSPYY